MFSGRGRRGRGATRGDNEIEMAKADHRIGWLNGGGAEAGRWTRGLIRTATALCNGSCKRASCCSKLILNFNISRLLINIVCDKIVAKIALLNCAINLQGMLGNPKIQKNSKLCRNVVRVML